MFIQSARDLAADIDVGLHTPGSLANLVPVIRNVWFEIQMKTGHYLLKHPTGRKLTQI